MSNKPVAWTNQYCLDMVKQDGESNMWWMPDLAEDIPLYTHPVKEPSKYEMDELVYDIFGMQSKEDMTYFYDFAKAILRKVQEK